MDEFDVTKRRSTRRCSLYPGKFRSDGSLKHRSIEILKHLQPTEFMDKDDDAELPYIEEEEKEEVEIDSGDRIIPPSYLTLDPSTESDGLSSHDMFTLGSNNKPSLKTDTKPTVFVRKTIAHDKRTKSQNKASPTLIKPKLRGTKKRSASLSSDSSNQSNTEPNSLKTKPNNKDQTFRKCVTDIDLLSPSIELKYLTEALNSIENRIKVNLNNIKKQDNTRLSINNTCCEAPKPPKDMICNEHCKLNDNYAVVTESYVQELKHEIDSSRSHTLKVPKKNIIELKAEIMQYRNSLKDPSPHLEHKASENPNSISKLQFSFNNLDGRKTRVKYSPERKCCTKVIQGNRSKLLDQCSFQQNRNSNQNAGHASTQQTSQESAVAPCARCVTTDDPVSTTSKNPVFCVETLQTNFISDQVRNVELVDDLVEKAETALQEIKREYKNHLSHCSDKERPKTRRKDSPEHGRRDPLNRDKTESESKTSSKKNKLPGSTLEVRNMRLPSPKTIRTKILVPPNTPVKQKTIFKADTTKQTLKEISKKAKNKETSGMKKECAYESDISQKTTVFEFNLPLNTIVETSESSDCTNYGCRNCKEIGAQCSQTKSDLDKNEVLITNCTENENDYTAEKLCVTSDQSEKNKQTKSKLSVQVMPSVNIRRNLVLQKIPEIAIQPNENSTEIAISESNIGYEVIKYICPSQAVQVVFKQNANKGIQTYEIDLTNNKSTTAVEEKNISLQCDVPTDTAQNTVEKKSSQKKIGTQNTAFSTEQLDNPTNFKSETTNTKENKHLTTDTFTEDIVVKFQDTTNTCSKRKPLDNKQTSCLCFITNLETKENQTNESQYISTQATTSTTDLPNKCFRCQKTLTTKVIYSKSDEKLKESITTYLNSSFKASSDSEQLLHLPDSDSPAPALVLIIEKANEIKSPADIPERIAVYKSFQVLRENLEHAPHAVVSSDTLLNMDENVYKTYINPAGIPLAVSSSESITGDQINQTNLLSDDMDNQFSQNTVTISDVKDGTAKDEECQKVLSVLDHISKFTADISEASIGADSDSGEIRDTPANQKKKISDTSPRMRKTVSISTVEPTEMLFYNHKETQCNTANSSSIYKRDVAEIGESLKATSMISNQIAELREELRQLMQEFSLKSAGGEELKSPENADLKITSGYEKTLPDNKKKLNIEGKECEVFKNKIDVDKNGLRFDVVSSNSSESFKGKIMWNKTITESMSMKNLYRSDSDTSSSDASSSSSLYVITHDVSTQISKTSILSPCKVSESLTPSDEQIFYNEEYFENETNDGNNTFDVRKEIELNPQTSLSFNEFSKELNSSNTKETPPDVNKEVQQRVSNKKSVNSQSICFDDPAHVRCDSDCVCFLPILDKDAQVFNELLSQSSSSEEPSNNSMNENSKMGENKESPKFGFNSENAKSCEKSQNNNNTSQYNKTSNNREPNVKPLSEKNGNLKDPVKSSLVKEPSLSPGEYNPGLAEVTVAACKDIPGGDNTDYSHFLQKNLDKTKHVCSSCHAKHKKYSYYHQFGRPGRCHHVGIPSDSTSSESNTEKIDESVSEGEVNCKCGASIGEIHLCKFARNIKSQIQYGRNNPQKLLQREFGDPKLKILKQRMNYNNWVTYYVSRSPTSLSEHISSCNNTSVTTDSGSVINSRKNSK